MTSATDPGNPQLDSGPVERSEVVGVGVEVGVFRVAVVWAVAFYFVATGIEGTSSMKVRRDQDITRKIAWHQAHRIRETRVGQLDIFSGKVVAEVVDRTDGEASPGLAGDRTEPNSKPCTDGARAYRGLPSHEAVRHSVGEHVCQQAHAGRVGSVRSMLRRGWPGTYRHMSPGQPYRYAGGLEGRRSQREKDTADRLCGRRGHSSAGSYATVI